MLTCKAGDYTVTFEMVKNEIEVRAVCGESGNVYVNQIADEFVGRYVGSQYKTALAVYQAVKSAIDSKTEFNIFPDGNLAELEFKNTKNRSVQIELQFGQKRENKQPEFSKSIIECNESKAKIT